MVRDETQTQRLASCNSHLLHPTYYQLFRLSRQSKFSRDLMRSNEKENSIFGLWQITRSLYRVYVFHTRPLTENPQMAWSDYFFLREKTKKVTDTS